MKKENSGISLEFVNFIFRHPWLFIYPFVIIFSVVFTNVNNAVLNYKCEAVVLLEVPGEKLVKKVAIQGGGDLLQKLLIGESIRNIITEVWPDKKEDDDPAAYRSSLHFVRNKIGLRYDGNKDLLYISVMHSRPQLCYKLVEATINALKEQNKRTGRKKLKNALVILRKQGVFYKDKVKKIDKETADLKSVLRQKAKNLTDEEKVLVEQILGEFKFKEGEHPALLQLVKYDELLTGLNLELLEFRRKKQALQRELEGGMLLAPVEVVDFEKDSLVQQYSEDIAEKELAMAKLIAGGYTEEHPGVKNLKKEINIFKILKEKRLAELESKPQTTESSESKARMKIKAELEETTFQVSTLTDKINMIEILQKRAEDKLAPPAPQTMSALSEEATRFTELKKEKQVVQRNYSSIRSQIEDLELKLRFQEEEGGLIISVLESPILPTKPLPFQKLPKLLMGLIIGISAGTSLAFVVDALDDSANSTTELRELLQIPILASIDQICTIRETRMKQVQRNLRFIGLPVCALLSVIFANLFM